MQPRSLLLALCLACAASTAAAQSAAATSANTDQILTAAEAAMQAGNDRQAEALVARASAANLGLTQIAWTQVIRAEIALKRGDAGAALQALPSGSDHVPLYAERIEDLRGQALFQLRDPVAATRALVLRERYLSPRSQALSDNRDELWNSLTRAPAVADNDSRLTIQDEVTRGWVELASQFRKGAGANYAQWRSRHPRHPAYSRAVSLEAAANSAATTRTNTYPGAAAGATTAASAAPAALPAGNAYTPPAASAPARPYVVPTVNSGSGIALLVPLTGSLAATGSAVRDGFLNAAQQSASAVRVYDSGTTAEQALAAYQSAVAQGSRIIVGPLQKEGVTAIARLGAPAVPVIALNTLDAGIASPANLLQFGLSPEDEASAAADQAITLGQRRAVVLVPRSEWGRRVSTAFGERMREIGGVVVAAEYFDSGTVDPSKTVSRLMGMDGSESRHKALSAVLGKETEFEARRRGDIDFIFLAAKPNDGRVILPQLRFFRAGGLPLYTTSLLNEGRAIDWNPVRVCDMPWMLDAQGGWAASRNYAASQFPQPMREYPRLVALGTDAWRLASLAYNNQLSGDAAIAGATGRLRFAADGRIRRELACVTPTSIAVAPAAAAQTP